MMRNVEGKHLSTYLICKVKFFAKLLLIKLRIEIWGKEDLKMKFLSQRIIINFANFRIAFDLAKNALMHRGVGKLED